MVTKKQILAQLKELTDLIKSDEFNRLKNDSEELKRIKALLPSIKFKIKDLNYFEEEKIFQIRYELPVINLQLDENGNPNKNDFFYSSNVLEMISLEDMKKVQDFLERIKNDIRRKS